jgi:hypothetical protein
MTEYTREQILSMQVGRELDDPVAEIVMGWRTSTEWRGFYWVSGENGIREAEKPSWRPTKDISTVWKVEERIAELQLEGQYIKALCDIVGTPRDGMRFHAMDDWRIVHATPEQRCKAALLAVMGL